MRVLVLGGTGFIGSAAVKALTGRGHAVGRFHRGDGRRRCRDDSGRPARASRHREAFARFAPEVVIDTIAYTEADAALFVETFRGLARRAVVLSSQDVYAAYGRLLRLEGGAREAGSLTEDAPLRATRHPYRAKSGGPGDMAHDYEKILVEAAVAGHADLPATILRLPFVYGPGDPQRRLRPYLERMRGPEILLDRAKASWRWTRGYVEDVGEAVALAAGDERAAGRTYNVGEEDSLTEAEWVRAIGEAAGWSGEVRGVPAGELPEGVAEPFDFSQDLAVDTRRIRKELGFREPVGRAEGLRRTVDWERAQRE